MYVDRLDDQIPVEIPTEDWHTTVLEDHTLFSEFGIPFDPRALPEQHVRAHLAIIRGRRRREQEEAPDEDDLEQPTTPGGHP